MWPCLCWRWYRWTPGEWWRCWRVKLVDDGYSVGDDGRFSGTVVTSESISAAVFGANGPSASVVTMSSSRGPQQPRLPCHPSLSCLRNSALCVFGTTFDGSSPGFRLATSPQDISLLVRPATNPRYRLWLWLDCSWCSTVIYSYFWFYNSFVSFVVRHRNLPCFTISYGEFTIFTRHLPRGCYHISPFVLPSNKE